MEGHLVLLGVKYLDWRVKLYLELGNFLKFLKAFFKKAHSYEELG